MDIHKGIANMNKLMNRLLIESLGAVDFRLASVQGGGLRNAALSPKPFWSWIPLTKPNSKAP